MIYITDEYIHPTGGCYQIQSLIQQKITDAHANGYLKAFLRSQELAVYLSEQLGFQLPDTPRLSQEQLGEFRVNMQPGDSMILVHLTRFMKQSTNGGGEASVNKAICLEFFLYGGGSDAIAMHLIHESAMQDKTIPEVLTDVKGVIVDFVTENMSEAHHHDDSDRATSEEAEESDAEV